MGLILTATMTLYSMLADGTTATMMEMVMKMIFKETTTSNMVVDSRVDRTGEIFNDANDVNVDTEAGERCCWNFREGRHATPFNRCN